MTAILVAGLLLGAGAQPEKIQCKDGTWHDKGRGACKNHGKRAAGGKRSTKRESRATAICRDSTFWRGELDQHACEGNGGVKEPL
jgi:hypothetical protein